MKKIFLFIGLTFTLNSYSFISNSLPPSTEPQFKQVIVAPPKQKTTHVKKFSDEDIYWMAKNVYFEARNESLNGQIAVIMVTMNRVSHPEYPNTIKEVVTQRNRRGCQFSWYCDGLPDKIANKKVYEKIRTLVLTILPVHGTITDMTKGAIFYHAYYVNPHWRKHVIRTAKIGAHIFYREKV